jgi:prepilin-type N-terminal cleavage/methylation domain-containing protein
MKNKRAFTIIELIITVTIVAIIAVVAVPWLVDSINGAKENTLLYNLNSTREAINKYYRANNSYPRSLMVLQNEGFLSHLPKDPTTGKVEWEIAVNYWSDTAEAFVEAWVIDSSNSKFASVDFIIPVQSAEPYFDPPISPGMPRYSSNGGIRNIRSANRLSMVGIGGPSDPRRDPANKNFGRPLYQYWRINKKRGSGVIENYFPFFLGEADSYLVGRFDNLSIPSPTKVNYPEDGLLFDRYGGNYFFNLGNSTAELRKKTALGKATNIVITGVTSFYE